MPPSPVPPSCLGAFQNRAAKLPKAVERTTIRGLRLIYPASGFSRMSVSGAAARHFAQQLAQQLVMMATRDVLQATSAGRCLPAFQPPREAVDAMSGAAGAATTGHVLIVGAGLGGLYLAQGLAKHGISYSVFERDETPDARAQGYRLKIFPDTVPDMQYLTTPELFAEFEAQTAETVMVETSVNAIDGRLLARRALRGPKPYTVDRGFLRRVLLRGLEDRIHWGKDATHYEVDESDAASPVTVHFADGTSASGALLVGADGGRSRIRRQHVPRLSIIDPEAVCLYGAHAPDSGAGAAHPARAVAGAGRRARCGTRDPASHLRLGAARLHVRRAAALPAPRRAGTRAPAGGLRVLVHAHAIQAPGVHRGDGSERLCLQDGQGARDDVDGGVERLGHVLDRATG